MVFQNREYAREKSACWKAIRAESRRTGRGDEVRYFNFCFIQYKEVWKMREEQGDKEKEKQRKMMQVKILEFQKKAQGISQVLRKPKSQISIFEKIQLAGLIEDVQFIGKRLNHNKIEYSSIHEYLRSIQVPVGKQFFNKGDDGQEFFILLKGVAHAITYDSVPPQKLITLQDKKYGLIAQFMAGDCFGQISVMYGLPRSTTVIAYQSCIAIGIRKEFYFNYLQQEKDVSYIFKILQSSKRFSFMTEYELKILSSRGQLRRFKESQIIIEQNKPLEFVFVVKKGRVKLYHAAIIDCVGEYLFQIDCLSEGQLFGEYVLGMNKMICDVMAVGQQRGEIAIIYVKDISHFPKLRNEFTRSSSQVQSLDKLVKRQKKRIETEFLKARLMQDMFPKDQWRRKKSRDLKNVIIRLQKVNLFEHSQGNLNLTEMIEQQIDEVFRKCGLEEGRAAKAKMELVTTSIVLPQALLQIGGIK